MKRYGILDKIERPADLRAMGYPMLYELCEELRTFLLDHISETGGHLASNLGIVELAVALERTFDSASDRLIYDVGHQCYVHKILTGRREQFHTLRQLGGISGFLKPSESQTDACITGHASVSVSAALGMAHARTIKNQKYHVVAVIGDGALTGGMAYEALNNAGDSGEPLIVILNDNTMSITPNVGAMSRHLARLRVSPRYLRAKSSTKQFFGKLPFGERLINITSRTKSRLKQILLPTTLFEQMGFAYLGPVDGHDLKSVCELLQAAKGMKKPVLLHVMTKKGKGYRPAELQPEKYHGVGQFDLADGRLKAKDGADFSAVFGDELIRLASNDARICAVTAAMSSGTGLLGFAEHFPERFFDVGIAEEHAVTMAAGMAAQGLKPVTAIYSTFLQRGYDQLIHDCAIDERRLGCVFAVDRAGIVGADGATHNGVFDVAYLRSIPHMNILAPSSFAELRAMLSKAVYHETGPTAIRYPRGGEGAFQENTAAEDWVCLREGTGTAIVSYGIQINQAIQAAEICAGRGIPAAVYKLNRLSGPVSEGFLSALGGFSQILVCEDVAPAGAMGEAISCALAERGVHARILLRSTGSRFLPHGSVPDLLKMCGLDADSLADAVCGAVPEEVTDG